MNDVLQRLYDSEINFTLQTFWDGGFDWILHDGNFAAMAEGNAGSFIEAMAEIQAATIQHFPESDFTRKSEQITAETDK